VVRARNAAGDLWPGEARSPCQLGSGERGGEVCLEVSCWSELREMKETCSEVAKRGSEQVSTSRRIERELFTG